MANPLQILKSPLITEKGTLVAETGHVVFKVPPHATKGEIRRAVEALFSVKVSSVHTANFLGKKKRAGRILSERMITGQVLAAGELAWLAGLHPTLKKRARQHPRFVGR